MSRFALDQVRRSPLVQELATDPSATGSGVLKDVMADVYLTGELGHVSIFPLFFDLRLIAFALYSTRF